MALLAQPTNFPMRWRTLALLVVAVLAAHWFALFSSTRAWSIVTASSPAMVTRAIEAAPQAAAPAEPAPAAALPEPAPAPVKRKEAPAETAVVSPEKTIPPEEVIPPPTLLPNTATAAAPSPMTSTLASDTSSAENTVPGPQANALDGPPQFLPSGKFEYAVEILRGGTPQSASGTLDWATDGKTYALELNVSVLYASALRQTSAGSMTSDGLLPDRFLEKRFGRSETAAHFKRSGLGAITFSNNQPDAILLRGAQDRLSVLMQLAGMASGSPVRFTPGSAVSIQTVSVQEADTWLFTVEAEEIIQVPAGRANALRVVRQARKEFDSRVEVWLAPVVGYLPVRFRLTEQNGNIYDFQLIGPKLP
jgi:Protein of unknown function (DUF3108)